MGASWVRFPMSRRSVSDAPRAGLSVLVVGFVVRAWCLRQATTKLKMTLASTPREGRRRRAVRTSIFAATASSRTARATPKVYFGSRQGTGGSVRERQRSHRRSSPGGKSNEVVDVAHRSSSPVVSLKIAKGVPRSSIRPNKPASVNDLDRTKTARSRSRATRSSGGTAADRAARTSRAQHRARR